MDRVLDRLNIIPDHHIQLGAILLELDLHAIDLSGLSRCEYAGWIGIRRRYASEFQRR